MKPFILKRALPLGLLFLALALSCAAAPPSKTEEKDQTEVDALNQTAANSFDHLKDTIWILDEVRVGYGSIVLDRVLMASNQMADYFTLQFSMEGINGKAAPNRYFAPYAILEGNSIRVRPIAGTLIESLTNIGGLTERWYYDMLQTVTRWDYKDGILHLYAPGAREGGEVYLIFKANKI